MLLSSSVPNVFRSILEGSIIFRELGKYLYDKSSFLCWIYTGPIWVPWMSSFFINKDGVSKCHCHVKIPQFECLVYRKHFCKPLCSRVQNRAKSLICMSDEMITIPSGALWTSRTNFSPLFYTYKRLAINHF